VKEEKLLDNANRQGAYVLKRLGEFAERSEIIGDVRGKGLMIGVELVEDKDSKKPAAKKASDVIMRCWRRGVAVVTCGASTLRLSPPLTIQRDMLDAALDVVEDVVNEVSKEAV
jgi:4-aminobutyrate aminotransferase